MADNVAITPGTGAVIATDDISGVQYQIIKLGFGALDSVTLVSSSNGLPVAVVGTVTTKETRAATGTRTSVAASATSVTLLAANANRLDGSIYNDSSAILYVALGTASASLTSFTVPVAPSGFYEIAYGYTGAIQGIWASAIGNARITELT